MTKKTKREEVTTKVLTTINKIKSKSEAKEEEPSEEHIKDKQKTKRKDKRRISDKTLDSYEQSTMIIRTTKKINVIKNGEPSSGTRRSILLRKTTLREIKNGHNNDHGQEQ